MLADGSNFRVKGQRVVPPKGLTTTIVEDTGGAIYALIPFEDNLVIMLEDEAWKLHGGALTEITPTGGFPESATRWSSTVALLFGEPYLIVGSYGVNPFYKWNSTLSGLAEMDTTPFARASIGYRGRLVLGNVYDDSAAEWCPFRLQWSEINDFETWETGTAGFYDFVSSADEIRGFLVLPEDVLVVLRSETCCLGYPTGDAYDPLSLRLLARVGLYDAGTLQSFGTGGFFLGTDDVYRVDAAGLQSIGLAVRDQILSNAFGATLWSFLDVASKEYYLVVDSTAWIYNYEENTWSTCDMGTITCLGGWYATSIP